MATGRGQETLTLILQNPFDAFITPGVDTQSFPASPSNSTPKVELTILLNEHSIYFSGKGGKYKIFQVILGQPFCLLEAWNTQNSARERLCGQKCSPKSLVSP